MKSIPFWLTSVLVWGMFLFVMLNMFDHFMYILHLPKSGVLCEQVS